MNNTHFTDEQVALCAEALSSGNVGDLPVELQQHLKDCNECANTVAMVSEISDEIGINKEHEQKGRTLNLALRVSAAAVILILIGLGFYTGMPDKADEKIAQTIADTTKSDLENEKIVVNKVADLEPQKLISKDSVITQNNLANNDLLAYATHDEMEKIVDRFRTGAMRGNDVEVKSPILIEAVLSEVVLEWTNENGQELIVEFFNNKGEKLYEEITVSNQIKPNRLKNKGLYYWKLINEDFDLVFCGKIKLK